MGSCSQREQRRAAGQRCAAVSPPMQRMRARSWVKRRRLPCAHLRKRMMHSSRNHTGRLGVEISTSACGQDFEVIRWTSPQAIGMVAERRQSRREAQLKVYFQTGTAVLCGACSSCWKMLHVERCSCSAWDGSYGSYWAWDSARMVGRVVWWCSRIKVHFVP